MSSLSSEVRMTPEELDAIELERTCSVCDGTGGPIRSMGFRPCGTCGGTGMEPTPFGWKVLDLMERHFPRLHREATDDPS
jgi:hypothetical protein